MSSAKNKKATQLGMDPGTASYRLVKDLLFDFIDKAGHVCYRCGEAMTRQNFTVEHKEAWLDSASPVELFFSIENIAYSHHACNMKAAKRTLSPCGSFRAYARGCRCEECKECRKVAVTRSYTKERRRAQYLRTGN